PAVSPASLDGGSTEGPVAPVLSTERVGGVGQQAGPADSPRGADARPAATAAPAPSSARPAASGAAAPSSAGAAGRGPGPGGVRAAGGEGQHPRGPADGPDRRPGSFPATGSFEQVRTPQPAGPGGVARSIEPEALVLPAVRPASPVGPIGPVGPGGVRPAAGP